MCHIWDGTARAHVQGNDVPDLENGWTDCAQIWYTVGDRLAGAVYKSVKGRHNLARARPTISLAPLVAPKGVILVHNIQTHSTQMPFRREQHPFSPFSVLPMIM